jgi:hypothetical protein
MRRISRRVRRNAKDGNAAIATHYFELNGGETSLSSFHLKFGATLVTSSITFQTSNFESIEVAYDSTTAGDWFTETSVTITNAATSATGAVYHVGNQGALRSRLVVVVTTAGALDIAVCDKEA